MFSLLIKKKKKSEVFPYSFFLDRLRTFLPSKKKKKKKKKKKSFHISLFS